MTGLDPAVVGTEIRLGRLSRENAATKAMRLLTCGRVMVRYWTPERGQAWVRGDSGGVRRVDVAGGHWTCTCPGKGERCSHILAVKTVTVVPGMEGSHG